MGLLQELQELSRLQELVSITVKFPLAGEDWWEGFLDSSYFIFASQQKEQAETTGCHQVPQAP